jgi:predicted protein tyrosine phosphatase
MHQRAGFTHVISLRDAEFTDVVEKPGQGVPDIVHNLDHLFESYVGSFERLELQFDDVTFESRFYKAPTHEDIEAILELGKKLNADSKLLVHCHAGISRSPAVATLILLQMYPDQTADQIFDRVREIRPIIYPNRLILELGGRILNREEEILSAFRKHYGGNGIVL